MEEVAGTSGLKSIVQTHIFQFAPASARVVSETVAQLATKHFSGAGRAKGSQQTQSAQLSMIRKKRSCHIKSSGKDNTKEINVAMIGFRSIVSCQRVPVPIAQ
jgi:hypothetical protein